MDTASTMDDYTGENFIKEFMAKKSIILAGLITLK